MVENHYKSVMTIKQKLKLLETLENGESVTELVKDYGVGTE
jgi:uncharacterized protein (DUF433 family)